MRNNRKRNISARMESVSSNQIYAVTIWYHPMSQEADVIRLYQPDVAGVIVVDNSEEDNSALLADNPSVVYLPLRENKGIAAALNVGCSKALELGAVWALTMDQDSQWNQHTVKQYIAEVNEPGPHAGTRRAAAVSQENAGTCHTGLLSGYLA